MPTAALLTGALLAGASLPLPIGPLAFVGLAPLLRALVQPRSLGVAFRDGLVAGLLFFGIGFGWVFQSQVGGGLSLPLAYALAIPLLSTSFGVFALATAWVARRSRGLALAATPGLWVGIEFARSQEWLLAVPWYHLGYALADWPSLVQGASVFGLYGLSAWIVAVNAGLVGMSRLSAPARCVLLRRRSNTSPRSGRCWIAKPNFLPRLALLSWFSATWSTCERSIPACRRQ